MNNLDFNPLLLVFLGKVMQLAFTNFFFITLLRVLAL